MSEPLMEVRNVTKIFTSGSLFRKMTVKAVDDVSFKIPEDRATMITLAGESGSGKSTIARLLLGLIPPTSGEVLYKGKEIRRMTKREKITYRREVQAIFQDPYAAFNPFYTAGHALSVAIRKLKVANSRGNEQKIISEALEAVHLNPEIVNKFPHELSGGERQRTMIARALSLKPRIIIADEPVSMIDTSLKADILNTILELKEKTGISFIYVTHDLSTAYHISDDILVLYRGSIVESGDIEAVIKNPVHPYLKRLIGSIPIPDPDKRWEERVSLRTEEITYRTGESACKYYGRCLEADKEKCLGKDHKPLPIPVEPKHYVACHLVEPYEPQT